MAVPNILKIVGSTISDNLELQLMGYLIPLTESSQSEVAEVRAPPSVFLFNVSGNYRHISLLQFTFAPRDGSVLLGSMKKKITTHQRLHLMVV
jgi:hypothetical protein